MRSATRIFGVGFPAALASTATCDLRAARCAIFGVARPPAAFASAAALDLRAARRAFSVLGPPVIAGLTASCCLYILWFPAAFDILGSGAASELSSSRSLYALWFFSALEGWRWAGNGGLGSSGDPRDPPRGGGGAAAWRGGGGRRGGPTRWGRATPGGASIVREGRRLRQRTTRATKGVAF